MPIWRAQHEVWTNHGEIHEADERDPDAVVYKFCVPPPYIRRLHVVVNRLVQLPYSSRNIPTWVKAHLPYWIRNIPTWAKAHLPSSP